MKWFSLFLLMALVYVSGQQSVYDKSEEEQIEILGPLLRKLLMPRPRPVYQIHQLLRVHVQKCCNSQPMMDCCTPALCCDMNLECCEK
uniref:Androgenic gland hormone-like protein n=1 Tax=Macrobrachium rosenbergii TaxID=79674 RepID=B9VRH0_MACRS|nr:androgenic gland hormone-like protein [Macrobrachium rosenbergii]